MNSKQFAIVATITFLVGMAWLVTDIIFRTKASIEISPKLQSLLEPVTPNFDSKVLDIIEQETLDKSTVTIPSPSPITASPNPDIESTPSAQLNQ